ncbi:hypothetical protein BE15_31935 [Sorangium cellulosum]|uniref:Uncharacterized protein n=1 Tax=Sorangium cellulosum TaxID=56 RepID=A0A150QQ33_SORCE|nr:hypothetical protein BE15_31935 [Sorangium cellulosum]
MISIGTPCSSARPQEPVGEGVEERGPLGDEPRELDRPREQRYPRRVEHRRGVPRARPGDARALGRVARAEAEGVMDEAVDALAPEDGRELLGEIHAARDQGLAEPDQVAGDGRDPPQRALHRAIAEPHDDVVVAGVGHELGARRPDRGLRRGLRVHEHPVAARCQPPRELEDAEQVPRLIRGGHEEGEGPGHTAGRRGRVREIG